jgi:hypothetical protein
MATEEETLKALEHIASRLAKVDPDVLAKKVLERTISCRVPDHGTTYRTRIHAGGLDPFTAADGTSGKKPAQIRLTVASDDLVALANDEISVMRAWTSGKLKVEASFTDILQLRKIL